MAPYSMPDLPTFPRFVPLVGAYLLLAAGGAFTMFVTPSASLERQGGTIIVYIWAVLCIAGGLAGAIGVLIQKPLIEVIGDFLAGSACLTWTATLVLQAITTASGVPLPGACIGGMMTLFLTQQLVNAWRPRR